MSIYDKLLCETRISHGGFGEAIQGNFMGLFYPEDKGSTTIVRNVGNYLLWTGNNISDDLDLH
jgi:hypothetical protein